MAGLGRRLVEAGDASSAAGHRVSAASAYLRASNYLSQAFDGLDGFADDEQRMPIFAEHRAAFEKFLDHGDFTAQRLEIPYEDTTLPGWYLTPKTGHTGATLVTINGATARCRHCGAPRRSGAAPRLRRRPLRRSRPAVHAVRARYRIPPDWEAVLRPVTDYVLKLPGVDAAKLALYGISQAGYWVPRSLAFEHRYAAAVADPGVVEVRTSWLKFFPKPLIDALDKGRAELFNREISLGMKFSPPPGACGTGGRGHIRTGALRHDASARPHTITPAIAEQIVTPLLITDPDHEQFWPGQSQALAAMCRDGIATLARFTTAEGRTGIANRWHAR